MNISPVCLKIINGCQVQTNNTQPQLQLRHTTHKHEEVQQQTVRSVAKLQC